MDDRQPDDALTDATLDRDLEQALAVDPSPEFVARVREAIATEGESGWRHRWIWLAAGAAAVAITIAMMIPRASAPPPGELAVARPLASEPPGAPAASILQTPEVRVQDSPRKGSPTPTSRVARTARGEPEVLIPKDEAAALKRLMRGLKQGVVERSTSADEVTGIRPVQSPAPILVAPISAMSPITIEPLGFAAREPREQGVRQ
jgi:hypothetical protein